MSMLLLLTCLLARAAPDPAVLEAAWKDLAGHQASKGRIPVVLDTADFGELAQGEIVRKLVPAGDMLAAQAVVWIDQPVENAWVTIQDPEHRNIAKDDFPLTRLPGSTIARRLNYQFVKTPWPLANRQQVFAVELNNTLWQASDHKLWERAIQLESNSLATDPDPDAIWLKHLAGGFLVVDLAGGSMVLMRVETNPGGNVPQEIVTRLTQVTLGGAFKRLVSYVNVAHEHYTSGHWNCLRPDGSAIAPGSLKPQQR